MNRLKEIYAYREMIFSLVRRDLKGRYKGSALGFLWTFINPLLQLIVYTFVFSVVMRSGIEDYYLFLFVALIPWIFFSTCITGGSTCIWAQQDMVKKIYFPREVLPIAYTTSQFINMLLSFLVVFLVLLLSGKGISLSALPYLIPCALLEYMLALGVAFIVSAVTVYLRDMEYVLGILSMALQFLTPVMYSTEMVPENLRPIYQLNPMTPIINAYRDILYYKKIPEMSTMLSGFGLSVILLVVGFFVFNRLQRHFAENL
jgi:ABC-2 type transport system permease protein